MHRGISTKVILGDGLLGTEIAKQTGWDFISRKQNGFDITKKESFNLIPEHCDCVINCIAHTNTYSPHKEPNWNINYKAVADLVEFCNNKNIKLVHISTDYVYTNSKPNASENDVPIHGDNWYSYTKVLADAYIELKSNNYLICRETHKPHPFPYEKAWVDQIGNFDYSDTMAGLIIKLIESNATGIFNIGTELKSMLDLAQQTRIDTLPALKPDNVPANTSMNTDKLEKWLNQI